MVKQWYTQLPFILGSIDSELRCKQDLIVSFPCHAKKKALPIFFLLLIINIL